MNVQQPPCFPGVWRKLRAVSAAACGITRGPVETIVDSRDDDHDGSLQQLRDGTLICNYWRR